METDDLHSMTTEELTRELEHLKECRSDIDYMHSFYFDKTSVHMGAEKAENMRNELEEERKAYNDRIAEIEKRLRRRL